MNILTAAKKVGQSLRDNTVKLALATTAALGLTAGAAIADATYTVCTAERGCATDAVTLGRGKAVNWCVDGDRVTQSVSSSSGERSFNDALQGLANLAFRSAEAVERDGLTVVGFEARMDGCDGSWEPYCTAVVFGTVANNNVTSTSPNDLIQDLSRQPAEGCGLSLDTHPIVPLSRMGLNR